VVEVSARGPWQKVEDSLVGACGLGAASTSVLLGLIDRHDEPGREVRTKVPKPASEPQTNSLPLYLSPEGLGFVKKEVDHVCTDT